jgi:hypothetical protein
MNTLLALKIVAYTHYTNYKLIREYWREAFMDTPMPQFKAFQGIDNYDAIDYVEATNVLKESACKYLAREIDGKAKKPNLLGPPRGDK